MAKKTKKAPELSAEELQQQALALEEEKKRMFVEEYNALTQKYGYMIQPTMTLRVDKLS